MNVPALDGLQWSVVRVRVLQNPSSRLRVLNVQKERQADRQTCAPPKTRNINTALSRKTVNEGY
jgi:hypothetical protein